MLLLFSHEVATEKNEAEIQQDSLAKNWAVVPSACLEWGQKQGCHHIAVSERGTNIWLGGVVNDLEEVYKPSVASQRPVVL